MPCIFANITRDDSSQLGRISREIEPDQFMREIGSIVVKQTQRRIESDKTSPEGQRWPPWSEEYARQNLAEDPTRTILLRTGFLRDNIEFSFGDDTLDVGTDVLYGASHQYGIGVPERTFLGLSRDNEKEVFSEIASHMNSVLSGSIRKPR